MQPESQAQKKGGGGSKGENRESEPPPFSISSQGPYPFRRLQREL